MRTTGEGKIRMKYKIKEYTGYGRAIGSRI